jgi:hypothetical protein
MIQGEITKCLCAAGASPVKPQAVNGGGSTATARAPSHGSKEDGKDVSAYL